MTWHVILYSDRMCQTSLWISLDLKKKAPCTGHWQQEFNILGAPWFGQMICDVPGIYVTQDQIKTYTCAGSLKIFFCWSSTCAGSHMFTWFTIQCFFSEGIRINQNQYPQGCIIHHPIDIIDQSAQLQQQGGDTEVVLLGRKKLEHLEPWCRFQHRDGDFKS